MPGIVIFEDSEDSEDSEAGAGDKVLSFCLSDAICNSSVTVAFSRPRILLIASASCIPTVFTNVFSSLDWYLPKWLPDVFTE